MVRMNFFSAYHVLRYPLRTLIEAESKNGGFTLPEVSHITALDQSELREGHVVSWERLFTSKYRGASQLTAFLHVFALFVPKLNKPPLPYFL